MFKNISFLLFIIILAILVFGINLFSKVGEVKADTSTASVVITNVTPQISGVSLNSGSAIILTEGVTISITAVGTVSDNNSCKDLVSVKVAVHKSGETCATVADALNSDVCYFYEDTSPSTDASCSSIFDSTYVASASFDIYYYADAGDWLVTIIAEDSSTASGSGDSSTVTLNSLLSLEVTSSIDYGSVFVGATSSSDNTVTVTNTGNMEIDFTVAGADASCTSGSIPVINQEFSLSSFDYGSGANLASSTTNVDSDLIAPAYNSIPISDIVYWQIEVPAGVTGTCTTSITFTAISAL